MQSYSIDRRAQYVLQILLLVLAILIALLLWIFLTFIPNWLLWTLSFALVGIACIVSFIWLPLWFDSVEYTISDTHITKKSGVFMRHEQVMRTKALQYSAIWRLPGSKVTGFNFIPLHAYGGTIILAFLKQKDAMEIEAFLRDKVYQTGNTNASSEPPAPPEPMQPQPME